MKNKIDKKRLANKVLEDGIKKAVELIIVGLIVGLSLNALLPAIVGAVGGSFYFKSNKIANLGGKIK